MTNNTKEADETAKFLEFNYPILKNKVLTIHTNNSGEVKESQTSKKDKEELEKLRKAADDIDKDFSPYLAVVSVLMLREGWDVKNVTTIVGLRPFKAESKILPEQTIGRGLRKMESLLIREDLVVIGTETFLEFVESLKTEGVEFQYSPMGRGTRGKVPLIVEIDKENKSKDLESLDIPIPLLSPRIYREYKNLETIDISTFTNEKIAPKKYELDELKEIVFKDLNGDFSHKTSFSETVPDYRNIVSFFTGNILKESRLVSGFDILYPKVESFIRFGLFTKSVDLEDKQILRNLSDVKVSKTIYTEFKKAIDGLTIHEKGTVEIKNYVSLLNTKYKIVENQPFIPAKKSVFNKIIGDNNFELEFAAALENRFNDVTAFAKNTIGDGGVNFKIEYQAESGNIREYYPDFFVKLSENNIAVVELKGREDLDDKRKVQRLLSWCNDINKLQNEKIFTPVYVKQEEWEKNKNIINSFAELLSVYVLK